MPIRNGYSSDGLKTRCHFHNNPEVKALPGSRDRRVSLIFEISNRLTAIYTVIILQSGFLSDVAHTSLLNLSFILWSD